MGAAGQRRGADTKSEIRKVAIELFTERGYEGTSLREIAERLGITKAALYYHYSSKESIVLSIFQAHLDALDELVTWAREQPPGPELLSQVVDRMVALGVGSGMAAMKFAMANQHVVRDLHHQSGRENAFGKMTELFDILTGPDASLEETLRVRSALLSVNIVLMASRGLTVTDAELAGAARAIARDILPIQPDLSVRETAS
ncbi:AcrR family transcriptional regulator [Actinoplanes octamycinicus]|uniref:AcrR family transcriptional regulator n=2 Tax=Actinoplanes octamycinicus TaxID=135948 RepID=A0A7W7H535_9ACTN|nr:TetR/AcrR family transcriptional regulator [Actinoplanes octamycinicus]MBB4744131.1 AcrR family transcriptional regulator [Actinoplanes octamycinicus]GIE56913.1 TetR family transcriptional regulator [Actinoplanes octamycinicus]